MVSPSQITMTYLSKGTIKTGDRCFPYLPQYGTNFDAGAGLMATPWRANKISVLATEHYKSCGSAKTRWGVTASW